MVSPTQVAAKIVSWHNLIFSLKSASSILKGESGISSRNYLQLKVEFVDQNIMTSNPSHLELQLLGAILRCPI